MELVACSTVLYGENSHHSQEKSVKDNEVDHIMANVEDILEPTLCDVQLISDCNPSWDVGENGGNFGDVCDDEVSLEEPHERLEACLDFHTSHVDVNTIDDSEPLSDNRDAELSTSASKWPEDDEALSLWVKWRGRWQAGIKCARADWPLATVKAKPTHGRKSYIVIFFPHSRNYSWADTLLVCAIDELPQPIAHKSHKAGVQLVEDLTVARRFILKKLVIGVLNIFDQLPIQVLKESARDVAVWREFSAEASCCKCYPDLGRLLLKFRNMLLEQYIDSYWLQHSLHLWEEKCQNVLCADSVELLKEELVETILWTEVSNLRDIDGQHALDSEWKMWKHEVMKCFSTTTLASGSGFTEQPSKTNTEHFISVPPLITTPQASWKRPKLEVRRAEPNKSPQKTTIAEIDSSFFNGILDPSKVELISQRTPEVSNNDNQSQNLIVNGSSVKSRQCSAFFEAKGRRCVRWVNDGDDYCCAHLLSRFPSTSGKIEITPPMCEAFTTQGHMCKRRSLPGSSFCKKHSSSGNHLKRKREEFSNISEINSCKDIVIVGEAHKSHEERSLTITAEKKAGVNYSNWMPENFALGFYGNYIETVCCVGLGLENNIAICPDGPKWHSLYCEKHLPIWLKRARNGKCRIISKDVFLDLLRSCPSQMQKIYLHQACEIFYALFKGILSSRNQVPKDVQFQWALSEASKDSNVAELVMKLVSREKERLHRIWGIDLDNNEEDSSAHGDSQALVPFVQKNDGCLNCKICSLGFPDDDTLGTHWINNHNKEAQWFFRGYACAICLDSFTNKKVLETHVQERHHAQFVDHCMLIHCIPCGNHFGNSEELWSHVLSVHKDRFRQLEKVEDSNISEDSQQKPIPTKPASVESNSGIKISDKRFVCNICGLKFDLLPDLGRHHQAAHMGPNLVKPRLKKKGLHFYTYRLKSGRLSRPRLKKGLGSTSYRLRNTGGLMLKKRLQPINIQTHVNDAVRLTETQCSEIAKILCSEAHKTKARPNNYEILSIARSACCKVSLHNSMEQKYGLLPEKFYLKAAKLCSEHNIQVNWHQEGFICSRGCKPREDEDLVANLICNTNEVETIYSSFLNSKLDECEMDESHYVIDSRHFKWKRLEITIILCDDISFGQEKVAVPCVVEKQSIDSLHILTYSYDGKVVFLPWEGFTYSTKPILDPSSDVNTQNLQLRCSCSQSACSPETCDHVYLFNTDYENAKDIHGKSMEGRFPYDDKGRLILEDDYLVYECNNSCKCEKSCPNRVLQNGARVKLEIFKTMKKVWAVRTCENISRGTFVCEYVGEVLGMVEANKRRNRYGKDRCNYILNMGAYMKNMSVLRDEQAEYFIDATKFGNVSRFINHSCSPNLVVHLVLVESMDFQLARVGLYAKQDIKAGEELSFDYHNDLQSEDGNPCLCKATNCR